MMPPPFSRRPSAIFYAAFSAAVVLTLGTTATLRAQTTGGKTKGGPSSPAGKGSPAKKERFVDVRSNQFSEMTTPQGKLRTAWGGVVIKSEDTVLKTEQAVYNKNTEIANSPGKLQIDDAQNTVNGSAGTAFYRTRDAVITGQVLITLRPKPEDQNAPEGSARREFKHPATINCTKVEYNWKNRIAVATGNLTVHYEDGVITADKAVYYGSAETVELIGNVHYTKPTGEKGEAAKVIAVLKEGAEQFYAEGIKDKQVSGKLKVTDEDTEDAPALAPPVIPAVGGSPTQVPPAVPSGPAPIVPTPASAPPATLPSETPVSKP